MPTVEDIRARWADRIEHGKRCDRSNALDAHGVQDLFDALERTRADRAALRARVANLRATVEAATCCGADAQMMRALLLDAARELKEADDAAAKGESK